MLTESQVIERLRTACVDAGGQKAFARQHNITPSYVHDVLHKRRPPADRILAALGLERVVVYREVGSLEPVVTPVVTSGVDQPPLDAETTQHTAD